MHQYNEYNKGGVENAEPQKQLTETFPLLRCYILFFKVFIFTFQTSLPKQMKNIIISEQT